jgi:hypothetical protein
LVADLLHIVRDEPFGVTGILAYGQAAAQRVAASVDSEAWFDGLTTNV